MYLNNFFPLPAVSLTQFEMGDEALGNDNLLEHLGHMGSGDYDYDLASEELELGMEAEGGAADTAVEVGVLGAGEGSVGEGLIADVGVEGGQGGTAAAAVAEVVRGPSPRAAAVLEVDSGDEGGEEDLDMGAEISADWEGEEGMGMGAEEEAGIGEMPGESGEWEEGLGYGQVNAAAAHGLDEGEMVSDGESAGSVPKEDEIDPAIDALTAELLSMGMRKAPVTPSPASKPSRTPYTTPVSISKPAPGGFSPELGYTARGQGSASRNADGSPAAAGAGGSAVGSSSVSSTPSPVGYSSKAGKAGPGRASGAGEGMGSPGHTPYPSKVMEVGAADSGCNTVSSGCSTRA